jgi:hypothetical protein
VTSRRAEVSRGCLCSVAGYRGRGGMNSHFGFEGKWAALVVRLIMRLLLQ